MSLFKATYGYKLKILFIPRQVKKTSKTAKKEWRSLYSYIKIFKKQLN